jgi:4-hydroxy-tetrahydrodipicolinate synthase
MQRSDAERHGQGGIVVPLATPFLDSGDVDEAATRRVLEYLVDGGVHGILALGTTGEGPSMTAAVRHRLVELVCSHVRDPITVYASIGDNCVDTSLEAARRFEQYGVRQFVACPPGYYPLPADLLVRFYSDLAERIPGALWMYNIPAATKLSIPVNIIESLSHHPRIRGLKDSENDRRRLETLAGLLSSRTDFTYLVGSSALGAKALSLGAHGVVPSSGNLVPGLWRELFDRAARGDWDAVSALQAEADAVARLYQEGFALGESIAALKVVMQHVGLCGPTVLAPLARLDTARVRAIEQAVAGSVLGRRARPRGIE